MRVPSSRQQHSDRKDRNWLNQANAYFATFTLTRFDGIISIRRSRGRSGDRGDVAVSGFDTVTAFKIGGYYRQTVRTRYTVARPDASPSIERKSSRTDVMVVGSEELIFKRGVAGPAFFEAVLLLSHGMSVCY